MNLVAKRKPKLTKEETFREAVDVFLASGQKSDDFMKLFIGFYLATRPDSGLPYEIIKQVLEEKIDHKQ